MLFAKILDSSLVSLKSLAIPFLSTSVASMSEHNIIKLKVKGQKFNAKLKSNYAQFNSFDF